MRVPISTPYRKLKNFMLAGNELSTRKNVCFRFLRWAYSGELEDKEEFLRVLKEWRKEEGRVGKHRTLLERKGRKLAKQNWRRDRNESSRKGASEWGEKARREGIGVMSPEWDYARRREAALKMWKRRRELGLPGMGAKRWIVHSPTGEVFYLFGLTKLCQEHGLDKRTLYSTKRKPGKKHKGWWVEPDNSNWRDL